MQKQKRKQQRFTTLLISAILLLATASNAHVKPQPVTGVVTVAELKAETEAGPESKLPDIPEGYQTKFQSVVIRQQNIQRQLDQLQQLYKSLSEQLDKTNHEGLDLEKKMFDEMKLDPKTHHTKLSESGVLVIISDPPKKEDKK